MKIRTEVSMNRYEFVTSGMRGGTCRLALVKEEGDTLSAQEGETWPNGDGTRHPLYDQGILRINLSSFSRGRQETLKTGIEFRSHGILVEMARSSPSGYRFGGGKYVFL